MNNSRRLLIIGGSSFLGSCLCRHTVTQAFETAFTYARHASFCPGTTAFKLDVTQPQDVTDLITSYRPHTVINLAAINPGGPENRMEPVNGRGALYIARAAAATGCRFIHVSTDCIHNGHEAPYDDSASPDPINEYGRTKALGEKYICETYPAATIVRTSLIYSLDTIDRGTQGFIDQLQQGHLSLFFDVIRQPIPAPILSEALTRLIDISRSGPLNIAGSQTLTRAEFGKRMLDFWNIDCTDRISTASAAVLVPSMPLDLRLNITRAKQLLNLPLPGVDSYMQTFRKQHTPSSWM